VHESKVGKLANVLSGWRVNCSTDADEHYVSG
jgi:hypothetical protein